MRGHGNKATYEKNPILQARNPGGGGSDPFVPKLKKYFLKPNRIPLQDDQSRFK
jgi:hypothetical protein